MFGEAESLADYMGIDETGPIDAEDYELNYRSERSEQNHSDTSEQKETETMKAMNDYVICAEASEGNDIIEMPESLKEAVKAAKPSTTTEKIESLILADLPEGTALSDVTIYFRAAEGLAFPDDVHIAVPLKAIIAVKV